MKLYIKTTLCCLVIILIVLIYIYIKANQIPLTTDNISNLEIVVAVYEEDISWLNKIPPDMYSHMYIYNKGKAKEYSFPKSTVISLPNEGYEAKTYLTHITSRYDKLADTTLFIPGTAWTKSYKRIQILTILKYLTQKNESAIFGITNKDVLDSEKDFVLSNYSYSNSANRSTNPETKLDPAILRPYGKWFEYTFSKEEAKCSTRNGILAVSRTDIHKRSRAFYLKLLSQLNSKSPEVGHYIERSWSNICSIPKENCINVIDAKLLNNIASAVSINKKHLKFAVMAIFKNEAMGIREWIQHYQWQGVDEILLLNNGSTDNWKEKIQGLKNLTVLDAPKPHAQLENYNKIGIPWLKSNGVDVVAVLDLDEYMFGKDGKILGEHIQEAFNGSESPSIFTCPWTMFGSSGLDKQPESIRKEFIWRKKHIPFLYREFCIQLKKSVFLLKDLEELDVHIPVVVGNSIACPKGIQLNHYAIQSKEYYEKVKMSRGDVKSAVYQNVRDWKYFEKYDFNDEKDTQLRDLLTQ